MERMGTTGLHLLLAWGFVGIPLAWGVIETLLGAIKLFQ
jgi:Na+/H+ antiporter NhaC